MIDKKEFVNGFLIVERDGKKNYISQKEEFLSEVWFDDVNDFTAYGLAFVRNEGVTNVINNEGKLLLTKEYRSIRLFGNIIIAKEVINKPRRKIESIDIINKNGEKALSCKILKYLNFVKEGYILLVDKEFNRNIIDRNGKFLFDSWYPILQPIKLSEDAEEVYFYAGKYNSRNRRVYNVLDKEGKTPFSRKWFEYIVWDSEETSMGEALVIPEEAQVKYNDKRYIWYLSGKNNLKEVN